MGLAQTSEKGLGEGCPACGGARWDTLLEVDNAPISCAQLFQSREAAQRAYRCRLEITICRDCAHIWNAAYRPPPDSVYDEDYYSSVIVSEQAREHQVGLAKELDRLVGLKGKEVLEIGCGDGFFLQAISQLEAGAIGFEPSATFSLAATFSGVQVFNEHFDFTRSRGLHSEPDMVVMRHVLEHLPSPRQQLRSLATSCFPGAQPSHIFLEVPNAHQILKDSLFFDFYHDHIQYFSLGSLHRLLTDSGWLPATNIGPGAEFLVYEPRSTLRCDPFP
jgi:SAM-dependent methyltransferase